MNYTEILIAPILSEKSVNMKDTENRYTFRVAKSAHKIQVRQAIETDTYPTATFKTTQPIDLGTLPADGKTVGVNASGDFTLHGVTRSVTIALQAARQGGIIAVAGSLAILFSDYSVQKPSSFSVLSVDDHGTMELHLLFTHA